MIEESISLEQKAFDDIIVGNSTVTQVVPTEMEKKIKRNKVLFGKRIKQLQHIIKDDSYIPKGSTNSYHNFIFDMWQALVTGRKITPKMESAITKIVKAYTKTLNPEYKKKKLDYIGRKAAASPATGYANRHAKQQKEILDKVFK